MLTPCFLPILALFGQTDAAPAPAHSEFFCTSSLTLREHDEPQRFGAHGSDRWNVIGGYAVDIKTADNQLGLLGIGLSHFIIDHISLDAELHWLYINQRGSDAGALSFNMLFRWHFWENDARSMSAYMDGGAGVMFSTDHVPADGTRFNFTPQVGMGMSFDIGNDVRLLTGLRWHHISNARLSRDNPGRDHVLLYAGVSVPF